MCGIAGFIGRSKKPKLSFELSEILFDYIELRGTDAAGAWGVESVKQNRIFYHKEPIRSSQFIKGDFWNGVANLKPDILLTHARAASTGAGWAKNNHNNHPFVSSDKTIAMIHNGRIDEADYLTQRYETSSDTDSEVLLRMYEAGLSNNDVCHVEGGEDIPEEILVRMNGIRDIWAHVEYGAMAVAIGERVDEKTRYLFLFHNKHRPLWTIDLRKPLGQIFFFSTDDIWYRALLAASDELIDTIMPHERLVEVPVNQIWAFKIDANNRVVTEENTYRINVEISDESTSWEAGDTIPIDKTGSEDLSIITGLDETEKVIRKVANFASSQTMAHDDADWSEPWPGPTDWTAWNPPTSIHPSPTPRPHLAPCERIIYLANELKWRLTRSLNNGDLDEEEYNNLVVGLQTTARDLEGSLVFLEGHQKERDA